MCIGERSFNLMFPIVGITCALITNLYPWTVPGLNPAELSQRSIRSDTVLPGVVLVLFFEEDSRSSGLDGESSVTSFLNCLSLFSASALVLA
jgi:hypothetical protein